MAKRRAVDSQIAQLEAERVAIVTHGLPDEPEREPRAASSITKRANSSGISSLTVMLPQDYDLDVPRPGFTTNPADLRRRVTPAQSGLPAVARVPTLPAAANQSRRSWLWRTAFAERWLASRSCERNERLAKAGAGYGNRTRLTGLGSQDITTMLSPREESLIWNLKSVSERGIG